MRASFLAIRDVTSHPTTRGDQGEADWVGLIRNFLPTRYAVGPIFAVDHHELSGASPDAYTNSLGGEITVGPRNDDQVAVRAGLEPGERVVASGTFLVAAESRLRSATTYWASGHDDH